VGICKRDIHTVIQRGAVDRGLNDLDCGVVAHVDRQVGWYGDLWQADRARVGLGRGANDLEGRNHDVRHVRWNCSQAQVHVDEGRGVALEPAWLDGDGAAADGPFGAIRGGGHSAARIHPLHAVRPYLIL